MKKESTVTEVNELRSSLADLEAQFESFNSTLQETSASISQNLGLVVTEVRQISSELSQLNQDSNNVQGSILTFIGTIAVFDQTLSALRTGLRNVGFGYFIPDIENISQTFTESSSAVRRLALDLGGLTVLGIAAWFAGIAFQAANAGKKIRNEFTASIREIQGTAAATNLMIASYIELRNQTHLTAEEQARLVALSEVLASMAPDLADSIKNLSGEFGDLEASLQKVAQMNLVRSLSEEYGEAYASSFKKVYELTEGFSGHIKKQLITAAEGGVNKLDSYAEKLRNISKTEWGYNKDGAYQTEVYPYTELANRIRSELIPLVENRADAEAVIEDILNRQGVMLGFVKEQTQGVADDLDSWSDSLKDLSLGQLLNQLSEYKRKVGELRLAEAFALPPHSENVQHSSVTGLQSPIGHGNSFMPGVTIPVVPQVDPAEGEALRGRIRELLQEAIGNPEELSANLIALRQGFRDIYPDVSEDQFFTNFRSQFESVIELYKQWDMDLPEVMQRAQQHFAALDRAAPFKQFQEDVSNFISAFNVEMKAFGQDVAIERFRGQFESILETGARLGQEIPAQLQPIVAIFQAHEAELQRLAEERIKALAADEAKLAEDKRLEELRAHWNEQAKLRDEALLQWGSFGDKAAVLADQAREEISRIMLLFNYDQEKVTTTSINIWQDYFSNLGEEGKAMAAQMVAMATLTGAWSQEAVAALAFLKGQFGNDNMEEDNDLDTGYWDTIGSAASTAFIDGFRSTMRNLNDIGDAVGVAFGEAFTASGGQMILNWVNGADGTFETVEEALNEKFGELFGGIAASFLPVFGQLISSGVSSILSSFASMFGGPSNEEIAERGGKQMGWRWGSAFTSEAKAAFQRALEELPKAASGKYNVGLAKVAPEVLQEIVAGFSSFSDEIQRKLAMDIGNGINSFAQALGLTLEESFQRYAPVIEDAFSAALEFGESLNPELLGLIEHARNLGIEFEGFQDAVAEAFEEVISSSDISVEKLKQIATTARQVGVDAEEALRDAFDGALEGAELTFEAIAEIRRAAEEMGLDVALESALAVSRVLKSEIDELTAGIGLAASNAHAVREGLEKLLTANVIDVEKIQSLVDVAREAGVSVESVFNRAFKQFIRDGELSRQELMGLARVAEEAGIDITRALEKGFKAGRRELRDLNAEGREIGRGLLDLQMQKIQGRQQAQEHRKSFKESYAADGLKEWEADRREEIAGIENPEERRAAEAGALRYFGSEIETFDTSQAHHRGGIIA